MLQPPRLEYPTLYASGKAGFCARSLEEAKSESRPTDMVALYETIRDVVPPPEPAVVASGMSTVPSSPDLNHSHTHDQIHPIIQNDNIQ